MTPADLKAARKRLGLTLRGMAEALELGPNGERSIRRYEKGERPVPGPVAVAVTMMLERAGETAEGTSE